jgi:hypothetical protein
MANHSRHSSPVRRYLRKELLHFIDGSIKEHASKEVERPIFSEHEEPPILNFGIWVVPAFDCYVQSWQDINPSIRNVTFSYRGL